MSGLANSARRDSGAGSVLALAIVSATTIVALAVVGLGVALAARQAAIGAADAAALAAADVLLGAVAGQPCEVADQLARANGAVLSACELDGYLATVTVRSSVGGVAFTARSTAGPPTAR